MTSFWKESAAIESWTEVDVCMRQRGTLAKKRSCWLLGRFFARPWWWRATGAGGGGGGGGFRMCSHEEREGEKSERGRERWGELPT